MNIPYLILGAIAGIAISRLIITARRRRAAAAAAAADTRLPSAADASERGDRASIPK